MKIKTYTCKICHTNYEYKEDAKKCEKVEKEMIANKRLSITNRHTRDFCEEWEKKFRKLYKDAEQLKGQK